MQLTLATSSFAQAKPPAEAFPKIPFFGKGNPLEALFAADDSENLVEVRKMTVSPAEEQEYGAKILRAMTENLKSRRIELIERGRDVEYVRKLIHTIRPSMTNHARYRTIRVLIAKTDETDAYSIPGGTIVVYQGMIDFAGSEAALIGVLGHELSHLDRGHQLLPLQRNKYLQNNQRGAAPTQLDQFFRQTSVFMSAFARPFHPGDETEADRDGATWAYQAGYDPREMSLLFARMNERRRGGDFLPAFLRTHPFHADRQAAVSTLFEELQKADPREELYVGRRNLRERLPKSVRTFEE